ncbi:MAG TPA: hypothetical protein VKW08_03385 [Xanthobacteraceae bacterium]|nr:hypothetical protein [Xanthobacteraceae bacterium]
MGKIVTVVAVIVSVGWGTALAQDQGATTAAPQADQQPAQSPAVGKPAVKKIAAFVHTHRRPREWYDWYYWPWNFIPANLPRDSRHRRL